MRILCHVHGYPPHHNAGAEWMLYYILQHLKGKGWDCEVMVPEPYKEEVELFGIRVIPEYQRIHRSVNYREADIVLTHLDKTGKAINNVRNWGDKPLVHLMHNTHYYGLIQDIRHKGHMVFNSKYAASAHKYKYPSMICRPHVPVNDYETNRGGAKYATLINCWPPKGGMKLIEMAEGAPDIEFLGVRGGYGHQVQPDKKLKNLTYVDNTPEIKEVYRKTKILLMPSEYESYGRTALEAACSGIPVICHPTPGLRESLGAAGIYIDRNDTRAWSKVIRELLNDPEGYKKHAQAMKALAKKREKETEAEMDQLHEFLFDIVQRDKPRGKKILTAKPRIQKKQPKKKTKRPSSQTGDNYKEVKK